MLRASPGSLVAFALATSGAGCAIANSTMDGPVLRAAADAPAQFVAVLGARGVPGDTIPGPGCRSPLFDPRDDVRLILTRSAVGRGDYTVPDRRYGVMEGELLRVDCNTGRPLGIVQR
jgi:hypothetical protein